MADPFATAQRLYDNQQPGDRRWPVTRAEREQEGETLHDSIVRQQRERQAGVAIRLSIDEARQQRIQQEKQAARVVLERARTRRLPMPWHLDIDAAVGLYCLFVAMDALRIGRRQEWLRLAMWWLRSS